jgi:ribokinase
VAIAVFGSVNMDLTTFVPRLPRPGETLFGRSFLTVPGGKGANQAVAAARLGARVSLFGRVGQDSFGDQHLSALEREGVDIEGVYRDGRHSTGLAVISVDDAGENCIIVIAGANMAVDEADVARLSASLEGTRVLLLQQEVPLEANVAAAAAARRRGIAVVLDPAPAREMPQELYPLIDVITPNEREVEPLLGHTISSVAEAAEALSQIRKRGVASAVIKMGGRGAVYETETDRGHIPAFPVVPVDTVAAGDAFNAGLAVALVEGRDFPEAVRWGAAAGALAVTQAGAMPSLPRRADMLRLLGERE